MPTPRKRWYRSGIVWAFGALLLGLVVGGSLPANEHPHWAAAFAFMSSAFIGLIKGLIFPLLLSTIIVGIAQTGDLKAVGRMGGKALLYFEVVTTLALAIGLVVVNLTRPGDGLSLGAVEQAPNLEPTKSGWDIALHALPTNLVKHASEDNILPIVVFATLFGLAAVSIGPRGKPVLVFFEGVSQTMFKYTSYIMMLTPIGVFGSMASGVSNMAATHTIATCSFDAGGAHCIQQVVEGWPAVFALLGHYAVLVGSLYLALAALIGLVFIPIMVFFKVPIFGFVRAIREPVLTAFSTASSEAALPNLMERLVQFGVPRRVAGFVVPAGYSFNLDGSTLYLTLASITIAQAANIPLTIGEQLFMLAMLVLTSKGVAAVPRATLVIIAATSDSFHLPGRAGVAMLLAVDGIMDMARTAVNVTGNALASVVVAKWERVFGSELESDSPPRSSDATETVIPLSEAG
jgi:Na+/H+-dicarboxylate symporter